MNNIYVKGLLLILRQLLYVLFTIPYNLWKAAVIRLAKQHDEKALTVSEIKSKWPMLSFIKRWIFEFLFDLIIVVGPFIAFFILSKIFFEELFDGHHPIFLYYIRALFVAYYGLSFGISILRDLFTLMLRPFAKLLSWLRKPAQHLDLTVSDTLAVLNKEQTQILNLEKVSEPAPESVPASVSEQELAPEPEVVSEPAKEKSLFQSWLILTGVAILCGFLVALLKSDGGGGRVKSMGVPLFPIEIPDFNMDHQGFRIHDLSEAKRYVVLTHITPSMLDNGDTIRRIEPVKKDEAFLKSIQEKGYPNAMFVTGDSTICFGDTILVFDSFDNEQDAFNLSRSALMDENLYNAEWKYQYLNWRGVYSGVYSLPMLFDKVDRKLVEWIAYGYEYEGTVNGDPSMFEIWWNGKVDGRVNGGVFHNYKMNAHWNILSGHIYINGFEINTDYN